jgi:hypothetical protein
MIFRFTEEQRCMDVKLEQLKGDTIVDIESIIFRKQSERNIEDILLNSVRGDNQELVIDEINISKENFKKLGDNNYKISFITLNDLGGNVVSAVEIILGNVDLRFKYDNVKFHENDVTISLAHMMVYPSGINSVKELEDE